MINESDLELLTDREFTARVKTLLDTLMLEENLTPTERVSSIFSSIVRLSLTPSRPSVIETLEKDGTLQSLIAVNGRGEIELERYWARRVLEGQNKITDYPYFSNYKTLTQFELQKMESHHKLYGVRMVFVGSGALPFTPVMFGQHYPSMHVDCIDRDPSFVQYSTSLVTMLGIGNVSVRYQDINQLDGQLSYEISNADVIFIAALIGSTSEEKNGMLGRLHPHLKSEALVAIRSVPNDMRRLLYPLVELNNSISNSYHHLGTYALPRESGVINSLVILSPKPAN